MGSTLTWTPPTDARESFVIAVCRDSSGNKRGLVYLVRPDRSLKVGGERKYLEAMVDHGAGGGGGRRGLTSQTRLNAPPGTRFEAVPVSDPKGRDVIVVTGPSGAGKSHFLKSFASNYRKMWPSRGVYLISSVERDATLDSLDPAPQRLKIDALAGDEKAQASVEPWLGALTLIDDVEALNKKQSEAVLRIQDVIATKGRSHSSPDEDTVDDSASLIKSAHLATNYRDTRTLLLEAHGFVVYPEAGGHKGAAYLLSEYGGLDKGTVADILRTPTRWAYVHTGVPRYLLTEEFVTVLT